MATPRGISRRSPAASQSRLSTCPISTCTRQFAFERNKARDRRRPCSRAQIHSWAAPTRAAQVNSNMASNHSRTTEPTALNPRPSCSRNIPACLPCRTSNSLYSLRLLDTLRSSNSLSRTSSTAVLCPSILVILPSSSSNLNLSSNSSSSRPSQPLPLSRYLSLPA